MKSASAKQKGRRFQQWVRDRILERFPSLEPDDVKSTSMGASGEDVLLSPAARRLLPISIETKNVERIQIWEAIKQAEANAGEYTPVVFFTRNRTSEYAVLPAEALLDLYQRLDVAASAIRWHVVEELNS
jgi:hypothetical protein